ncbi:MAG: glycosyl hydrolase [candidate division WOR-3 bacterium]
MVNFYSDSKPWTRWWWFNVELKDEDIRGQLDWAKANGFGGVELAFVYPLPGQPRGPDWLSPEWSQKVALAKHYCDSIGLGCDFTFGTLWPFGGSFIAPEDASQTFAGPSKQKLGRSWELPVEGRILNHLSAEAIERYSARMSSALAEALKGSRSALFCDSWEVETEGLWTEGFGESFQAKYGYDVEPFMPELDKHPGIRYDYRKLIAEYVLESFYRPFTEVSHRLGSFTRVQCHGAPTDLLAAYAAVDVPESEAILFDPEFSRIPASAATLTGKPVVSAEAFTCLYGWVPWPGPGQHQGKEQVADLKLLADALFANGINHIFWHGMPYQPHRFYATVHVGPDGALAPHLPAFNAYMEKVCRLMKQGRTYSDVAVYLPLEDNLMLGELPKKLQKPSAKYHWEMHYLRPPAELTGFHPLWVSHHFLKNARYEKHRLLCGDATFSLLYLDCEWLDSEALDDILRLARQGLPVCLKQKPKQPGHVQTGNYYHQLSMLVSLPNVSPDFKHVVRSRPLVETDILIDYWCREIDGDRLIFFANPGSRNLTYPLEYGQAHKDASSPVTVSIKLQTSKELELRFAPHQSLLLKVSKSGAPGFENLDYVPPVID